MEIFHYQNNRVIELKQTEMPSTSGQLRINFAVFYDGPQRLAMEERFTELVDTLTREMESGKI